MQSYCGFLAGRRDSLSGGGLRGDFCFYRRIGQPEDGICESLLRGRGFDPSFFGAFLGLQENQHTKPIILPTSHSDIAAPCLGTSLQKPVYVMKF